ncbi:uncharacterized protein LOC130670615 [Microplitis mediator]|uniref:uncharacterized protein LOC130670615 n=1 Tax=Microplitis mediator TaxID=375433 RepID=UPI0025578A96|nr:uncharacterized protein LOC130670615 [Microplitis mediator]
MKALLIFLAIIIEGSQSKDVMTIQPLADNPGLLYDPFKRIHLIDENWCIISSINVKGLVDLYPFELEHIHSTMLACAKIIDVGSCMHYLKIDMINEVQVQIYQAMHRLDQLLDETNFQTPPLDRNQRAPWFGFIGTISRELFGTMDYEDKEHINKEINKLYQDNAEMVHLVQNATHIVKSEINTILQSEAQMQSNLNKLADVTHAFINATLNSLEKVVYVTKVLMLGDERLEVANHHLRVLREAETIIEEAKAGRLSPQAISPKQLYKATIDIMRKHPDLNPPQPIDRMDLSTLSAVSTVKVARAKGYLLIIVTLPLFHKIPLLSYEMRPLPKPENVNGKIQTLTILPSKRFLVTDPGLRRFFLADSEYINKCRTIGEDLSCRPDIPFQSTEDPEEVDCEMKLLLKSTEDISRTCNIRIIPDCKTTWIKLNQPNSWAYSTCKEEKLSLKCLDPVEKDYYINGTGMIHIQGRCEMKNGKYLIKSIDEEITQLNITLPKLNLTLEALPTNLTAEPKVSGFLFKKNIDPLNTIDKFQPWGAGLEETENRMSEISLHHQEDEIQRTMTAGNMSILVILYVILIVPVFLKCCICSGKRRCSTYKKNKQPVEVLHKTITETKRTSDLKPKAVQIKDQPEVIELQDHPSTPTHVSFSANRRTTPTRTSRGLRLSDFNAPI